MRADTKPSARVAPDASAQQQLSLVLAAGKMGVWELELEGDQPLVLSGELLSMLALEAPKFDRRIRSFLRQVVHPADWKRVMRAVLKTIRGEQEADFEFRFQRPGCAPGWLLARGRICRDSQRRPVRVVGVGIDITARKLAELECLRLNAELERRMAERTTQLEAAHRELDAFCYSVSHDLRAPLRSVRGFNEVLLERYGSKLDPRGQEFLQRGCEASHHMEELIENLLKLSRVGRSELSRGPVNLSALASEVAAELHGSDPSRQVEFEIAPGLKTIGDKRLLRIVLANLLGNAWKFTSKREHASIGIGFAPSECAFYVRDDGAGFDPAYAGKLFGVFQRLHSSTEFAGTGVGLAMVQRIVHRHGGRVWAQGTVDQGATFFFSLPTHETT